MSQHRSPAYYEDRIRRAVRRFLAGSIGFVLFEFIFIWMGVLVFTRSDLELPSMFVVFGLGSVWLLWEMAVAATFRTPVPGHYEPVNLSDRPALAAVIGEVTSSLGLSVPSKVYMTDGVDAAVFCRPDMLSLWRKPKYELVLGRMLVDIVSDDELRVILYHEFGHYTVDSLSRKAPAYVVSQFSRSFTSIKKLDRPGVWRMAMKSQVALFSYFSFWMCSIIDGYFRHISRNEEYRADDVAVRHTSAALLCSTLAKVAVISSHHRFIMWARTQIPALDSPDVDTVRILRMLCIRSAVTVGMLPPQVVRRIGRYRDAAGGQLPPPRAFPASVPSAATVKCTALLMRVYPQYVAELRRCRSVRIRIFLPSRRHRLPLVDGRYQIVFDGEAVGVGNFIKGYSLELTTSPGRHVVATYAVTGINSIPVELDCEEGRSYTVEMDYKVYFRTGTYEIFAAGVTPA